MTEDVTFQATSAVAALCYNDQPILDGKGTKSFVKNTILRLKNSIYKKKVPKYLELIEIVLAF